MPREKRDNLYAVEDVRENFVFNERVAEVFDDMLDRSIPYYRDVIRGAALLLDRYLEDGDTIYDLGCSNGTSLLELMRCLDERRLQFIGLDNSQPMLEKARLKAELFQQQGRVRFLHEDITEFRHEGAGAIVLNYTLQFIRPLQRAGFVKRLFDHLKPGGIILLSEKIICQDSRLNRDYIDIYHGFKKRRGYSELEIAKKREALENVLIPFTPEENRVLLTDCGFQPVETFFQWFNFASFVGRKPVSS